MKIVCDNKIPFLKGVFEPYAEVLYLPGKETGREAVRDADALITRTRTICNEGLLKGSSVRVIATATIGFDHIDTAWCEGNGIVWKNAPGCNSWSVKQYLSSVLCTLAERHSLNLEKMTLGVVGVGNVGSKVAEAASLLGMRVLLNDPPRERKEGKGVFVGLDEIISESDIITLHVPLSRSGEDATFHLFDKERIARLKKNQFLINSSRGPVVDNAALKQALKKQRIAGAVLDVWEGEPELDRELISLLDIATPHIAGYSADGKANGTTASVRTVAACLGIEPLLSWAPSELPAPRQELHFKINTAGKTRREVLSEAVKHTYDVLEDDRSLRASPELFEKLRGDYPVRREFTAFSLSLEGGDECKAGETLRKIGFNITNY